MKQQTTKLQKVQIVNFITFCLLSFGAFSQESKIIGNFCEMHMPLDTGRCYDFREDGSFSYTSGGDIPPHIYGEGMYVITNKSLILKYKNNGTYKISYHQLEKQFSPSDSINIDFNVKNLKSEPISGTNVLFENNFGFSSGGIQLDQNGKGRLKLKKSSNSTNFRFSYIGYNIENVEIKKDYSYVVNVYLSENAQNLPIADHIDSLKVIKLNKKILWLKNKNGKVSEWLRRK